MSEFIPPPPSLPDEDFAPAEPAAPVPEKDPNSVTDREIELAKLNVEIQKHQLEIQEHALEVKKHDFEVLKWRQDQAVKDREWDQKAADDWRERVQNATNSAYFHRHALLGRSIELYLNSLFARPERFQPATVSAMLDEFWHVYGTVQALVVRAPFENPSDAHLKHEPLEPVSAPEEHF